MKIRKLISEEKYNYVAGSLWPLYNDFQNGLDSENHFVQNEINKYLEKCKQDLFNEYDIDINTAELTENELGWDQLKKPIGWNIKDFDVIVKRKIKGLPSIKENIKHYCSIPQQTLNIDYQGRVFTCMCEGWCPFPIGHINDFTTFNDVLKSTVNKSIIQSIDDRTYNFCDIDACGTRHQSKRKNPFLTIIVGIDKSCNLTCPSCRERLIFFKDDKEINKRKEWVDKIYNIAELYSDEVEMVIGGNGEPFASYVYEYLFEKFITLTNVKYQIKTNGLLVKREFEKLGKNFVDNIKELNLSIDAGTKETYELVRRGAKWEQLLDNLDYIKNNNIVASANIIIQKSNYNEANSFIDLCNKYNIEPRFSFVEDWGTWHNYAEHAVHIKTHPEYENFKQIFSNLTSYDGVDKILGFNE